LVGEFVSSSNSRADAESGMVEKEEEEDAEDDDAKEEDDYGKRKEEDAGKKAAGKLIHMIEGYLCKWHFSRP
jgi:hypothetical protein